MCQFLSQHKDTHKTPKQHKYTKTNHETNKTKIVARKKTTQMKQWSKTLHPEK
jgi:hypothetical protein